jgi:hypothetical protein
MTASPFRTFATNVSISDERSVVQTSQSFTHHGELPTANSVHTRADRRMLAVDTAFAWAQGRLASEREAQTSLASSVISALRTFETGQFFSASLASCANFSSSRFGTLARSVRADRLMRNP